MHIIHLFLSLLIDSDLWSQNYHSNCIFKESSKYMIVPCLLSIYFQLSFFTPRWKKARFSTRSAVHKYFTNNKDKFWYFCGNYFQKSGAPNEKNLAKYLKYHFLVSKIVTELFKGTFPWANTGWINCSAFSAENQLRSRQF